MSLDLDRIRLLILKGLYLDDTLAEELVLKGGNALRLVHQIGDRASVDLDFSLDGDFEEGMEKLRERAERGIREACEPEGFYPFDVTIQKTPRIKGEDLDPTWGGYMLTLKLADGPTLDAYGDDIDELRKRSLRISPPKTVFKIDVSKHEYVEPAVHHLVDNVEIRVYTALLQAAEKLRAICQQLPEYKYRHRPKPRPRDFVDLWQISEHGFDLCCDEFVRILGPVFDAKDVELSWLKTVHQHRDFHAAAWDSVLQEMPEADSFDFYFEFVLRLISELEARGVI